MNHLIVHCSPISNSYTKKIALRLEEIFRKRGDRVVVRDLRELNFNPVLTEEEIVKSYRGELADDVKTEQEFVTATGSLHLVYPLYQLAMPAVIKGYVDRVLCHGFAYRFDGDGNLSKLMTGKFGSTYSPMAAPMEYLESDGSIAAMNLLTTKMFNFRGFEVAGIHYFDMTDREARLQNLDP